jgi:hypothetical protein
MPFGATTGGDDVGDPLGLIPGPSGVPFGAVPVSPLGETPGPRGIPFGAIPGGGDVGDPSGLTLGPSGVPFGAVPISPLGETPGPRGTPFGATAGCVSNGDGPWVSCKFFSCSQSKQCVASSSMPMYGQGSVVVVVEVGEPLGFTPGPSGVPLGALAHVFPCPRSWILHHSVQYCVEYGFAVYGHVTVFPS